MNVSIARLSLISLLVVTAAACMATTASAISTLPQTDLPRASATPGQIAGTCQVAGDRLFLTAEVGLPGWGLAPTWTHNSRIATTSIPIRPKASAKNARWRFQKVPKKSLVVAQSFDSTGRLFYVTQSRKRNSGARLVVRRVGRDGKPSKSFGLKGHSTVVVDNLKTGALSDVRVIPGRDGSALIAARAGDNPTLIRLTAAGKIDSGWGDKGRFKLVGGTTRSVSLTGDGSVLAGLSAPLSAPGTHVWVAVKLTPRGKVDTAWGAGGYWMAPPAPSGSQVTRAGVVRETLQTASGAFAFHYANEYDLEDAVEFTSAVAIVNATTGQTEQTGPGAKWNVGGDGGFPDADPEYFGATKTGVAFGRGESYYRGGGATYRGNVFFDLPNTQVGGDLQIKKFATNAFATDPKTDDLYACGGSGYAGTILGTGQLAHVAVRKITR